MAWRAIQDTVSASESLASLTDFAERLFWRMLAKTDPWGRLPGSARKIRAICVPLVPRATEQKIEGALNELHEAGRIVRYESDNTLYVQIVDFEKSQPSDVLGRSGNRYDSRYPEPPPSGLARTRSAQVRASTAESEIESETDNSAKALSRDVLKVYDHWRTARDKTHGRYDRISPGRLRKLRARLREFSADDLCAAIDAVALDPWTERNRYDDLTTLFKNSEAVDRWLAMLEKPPRKDNFVPTADLIREARH